MPAFTHLEFHRQGIGLSGSVLLTRGGSPLETGFQEGTLSSNRNLAEVLRAVMGY